jgi:hypothetical protein
VSYVVDGKKQFNWFCYDNKEDIEGLYNCLLEKGIREKKLKHSLKKLITRKLTFNNEDKKSQKEEGDDIIVEDIEMNINTIEPIESKIILYSAREIILKIEDKFSEYLFQFEKEWEGKEKRQQWREILQNSNNFESIRSALTMLNFRFKNPYRSDEINSDIEVDDTEANNEKVKFEFTFGDNIICIYEFDRSRNPAPKVKIWPKDLESSDMERCFNEVLSNSSNILTIMLCLYFYESVILNLVKRRETANKRGANIFKGISQGEQNLIQEDLKAESKDDEDGSNTVLKEESNTNLDAKESKMVVDNNDFEPAENTVSVNPDQDETESVKLPSSEKRTRRTIIREQISLPSTSNIKKKSRSKIMIETEPSGKKKKTTQTLITTSQSTKGKKDWKETCYICDEYGELVCCDGCTNVAHLFCACLSVSHYH